MKVYRSKHYEALHEDFKGFLAHGMITPERMAEFEKDAFKEVPDAPHGRAASVPAMAASTGPGRSVKG
ncbi:hypothetical protein FACS189485_16720 [Spirochaetia bacterium]|nr:hypothetical protein FACS189485_16720 [Spirochaetia bacterium]